MADHGEKIRVLTGYPTYPDWVPKFVVDDHRGAEIVRGGLHIRYPTSPLLRRALLEVWFFVYVLIHLAVHRRTINKAVCVLPPSLFVFALLCLLPKKTKIIGIVHDLQGVNAGSGGLVRRLVA